VLFPDLSEPERQLWSAFPRGAWVDLRTGDPVADDVKKAVSWGPQRIIRAEVIRALLLGAGSAEPGSAPAVRVRGARIAGRLDLMGAAVNSPLVCEHCHFDDELRIVEASTKTVRIVDSWLPALNGTRMSLDGILNLWSCVIPGVLRLDQAKVTGQVCLRGARIGDGCGDIAVAADGLAVDGDLDWTAIEVLGSVRLTGAQVSGSVDLNRARLVCPDKRALTANNCVIGGRLTGKALIAEGEVRIRNARIAANILLQDASLRNPGGVAFSGGGLSVAGGMFLDRLTALGEINLISARLGDILSLPAATLSSRTGWALNLERATMGDCDAGGLVCSGQIRLARTRISGALSLKRARLDAGAGRVALAADGCVVEGTVDLAELQARGEIAMRTGRVGQRILLRGARLDHPDGIALRLSGTDVAADVSCRDMTVRGGVRLAGTRIGSHLGLDQVRLDCPAGAALDARALQAAEVSLMPAERIRGLVNFTHARVGILRDDPGLWPERLSLDGLTYQVLEPGLPARKRLAWLDRDPAFHQPQPYEQLAAMYTSAGQPAEARHVLYTRERRQHDGSGTVPGRAWSRLQDLTVGYGYKPWRAAACLAVLLALGSIVYALAPPRPLQPGAAPHFNPVIYTLNLLVPVVDLGQRDAFNPADLEQWLSYVLIAAGWVLATTIATGAARVLRRQ